MFVVLYGYSEEYDVRSGMAATVVTCRIVAIELLSGSWAAATIFNISKAISYAVVSKTLQGVWPRDSSISTTFAQGNFRGRFLNEWQACKAAGASATEMAGGHVHSNLVHSGHVEAVCREIDCPDSIGINTPDERHQRI